MITESVAPVLAVRLAIRLAAAQGDPTTGLHDGVIAELRLPGLTTARKHTSEKRRVLGHPGTRLAAPRIQTQCPLDFDSTPGAHQHSCQDRNVQRQACGPLPAPWAVSGRARARDIRLGVLRLATGTSSRGVGRHLSHGPPVHRHHQRPGASGTEAGVPGRGPPVHHCSLRAQGHVARAAVEHLGRAVVRLVACKTATSAPGPSDREHAGLELSPRAMPPPYAPAEFYHRG